LLRQSSRYVRGCDTSQAACRTNSFPAGIHSAAKALLVSASIATTVAVITDHPDRSVWRDSADSVHKY
jgi:hypothetical protein